MPAFIDLTGRAFGLLTVIHRVPGTKTGACFICRCACGREKIINAANLRKGLSRSCGCRQGTRSKRPLTPAQTEFLMQQKEKEKGEQAPKKIPGKAAGFA